ncbi:MAG: EAL domain-containing protein [Anaerostipes sp.]|nr:EAL domain-containing protein [Anaerostipes sp.]
MKQKILIVEDNRINQEILTKILCDEYDIIKAYDGEQAYALIIEMYQEISAVILDLRMPKMDGKTLLSLLSQNSKYENLPIIIATGDSNQEMERECLKLGAWDFVTKPYDAVTLKLRLRNTIGRSQVHLIQEIHRLAERDELTGLYNRRFFMEQTSKMLHQYKDTQFVLIRMDIRNFRLYNSSFGSQLGDQLLQKIANEIRRSCNVIQTYGRMESDVFCVCIPYVKETFLDTIEEIEEKGKSLCENYVLKFSFGIYVIEDIDYDMEKICSKVTEAARKCKENLQQRYVFYSEDLDLEEERIQKITNEMEQAIEDKQFQVYLQPKYDMNTEQPCGAEALVRWFHPNEGMISPGEFIPVYEKNGQIVELDHYMWESVCQLLRKWIDEGFNVYPVSVNVSRVSLYHPDVVEYIIGLVDKYKLPRELLNLEITESAYMSNPELMLQTVSDLRKHGFVIMMDDFGSGYSSLNTLKDMEVDILKVDMKFLPAGTDNVKSEKILASVIRMAGWLGMPVVVEGVETKDQRDFVDSIGCNYVQGFYYARPMAVTQYEQLIQNQLRWEESLTSNTQEKIFDTIWSSDSEMFSFFKSILVPFAIIEYDGTNIDMLRVNQAYINEIGSDNVLNHQLNHKELFKLCTTIEQTIDTKDGSECECLFVLEDGSCQWYLIRLFYLGEIKQAGLVSATFLNITSEKLLEKELNMVFESIKEESKKESVLVIDDSELSQELIQNVFQGDYNVILASTGEEGLNVLREKEKDIALVLLDMIMPHMGGQEFLSYKNQIKEVADIPVIVISAQDNEDMQIHMLENGVNDYVTKPFIPAVLKQRVKNVLEYNSRFRSMLYEYRSVNGIQKKNIYEADKQGYSVQQVRSMFIFLSDIFEIVRLVDPREMLVVHINEEDTMEKRPYDCFDIWGKKRRCENCSSLCALKGDCMISKYEMLDDDIFYVVSKPIVMKIDEERSQAFVLELINRVSEDTTLELLGNESIKGKLKATREMIYMDPLTNAYNRRFFDELLFLKNGEDRIAQKVGLIMIDIHKFKQINDLFGHQTGDGVLRRVVRVMKEQLREYDSIVRYGGDEFIVILTNCDESQMPKMIARLSKAIQTVYYGTNDRMSVYADFGYSYTERFEKKEGVLEGLLREADEHMYKNKNRKG